MKAGAYARIPGDFWGKYYLAEMKDAGMAACGLRKSSFTR
jgi:hypothetical protein